MSLSAASWASANSIALSYVTTLLKLGSSYGESQYVGENGLKPASGVGS